MMSASSLTSLGITQVLLRLPCNNFRGGWTSSALSGAGLTLSEALLWRGQRMHSRQDSLEESFKKFCCQRQCGQC